MPGLAEALLELQELTRRLRRDCPWDREQTARTIVPAHGRGGVRGRGRRARGRRREAARRARRPAVPGVLPSRCCSRSGQRRPRGGGAADPREARAPPSARLRRGRGGDARAACARTGSGSSASRKAASGIFHDVPESAARRCFYARKVQRRAAAIGVRVSGRRAARSRSRRRAPRAEGGDRRAGGEPPPGGGAGSSTSSTSSATCCSPPSTSRGALNVDPELALRAATQRFRDRVERAEQRRAAKRGGLGAS